MSWQLRTINDFDQYANTWDRINALNANSPILEARFLIALIRCFSDGNEKIAIYTEDSQISAIAILQKISFGRWETFQPSQSPLGAWVFEPHLNQRDLFNSLGAYLGKSTLQIGITQQDPNICSRPKNVKDLHTLDYIETAKITVNCSFDEYWASRGKNLRQNMNRQKNRLVRENVTTKLVTITEPDEIVRAIAEYGKLESTGWKSVGGTAIHPSNTQGKFYTSLLEKFCTTGNGRIYQYWYDDKMVATDMCISGNGIIVILKTTYDESQKTSSPALLMRREYFREIFDNHEFGTIEFYGKVMNWHTKWSDEMRTMFHINFYPQPIFATLKNIFKFHAS